MLLILAFAVALALHVFLGWQWSLVGGLLAGIGANRFGWALGSIAVALSWTALIVYNFAVAPFEMARFLEITSGLLGNMEGPMLVVTTILIGGLLGLLGGGIGSIARSLIDSFRSSSGPGDSEPAQVDPEIQNTQL